MNTDLTPKFNQHLATFNLNHLENKFLVGYSGGLDSTALLCLLAEVIPQENLAVAHLHHGLRGDAADADQDFAKKMAKKLGLKFITTAQDVEALAQDRRLGLEEAARSARYQFLSKAALGFGATFVLTAHQADDQAETVVLNLLRGAGAGGLAGIPPRRLLGNGLEVLRPLLPFSRAQLQSWLEKRNQPWVEDLSNQSRKHLRNTIRLDIMPGLLALNPGFLEAVGRTTSILQTEEDFWKNRLQDLTLKLVKTENEELVTVERHGLETLSWAEKRRLIYEALLTLQRARSRPTRSPSLQAVDTIISMLEAKTHAGLDLPGGMRAATDRQKLRLSPASRFKVSPQKIS